MFSLILVNSRALGVCDEFVRSKAKHATTSNSTVTQCENIPAKILPGVKMDQPVWVIGADYKPVCAGTYCQNIHRVRKKGATLFLPVTPRNANRFSKFFYRHALK